MKSPLTELKDYADSIYEMGFTYDPGQVISKLLTLISKLPAASLPSSSVTGEEVKDQKWFINQGIEFSKKMKTDSEAYKLGAGFGYSCGLQDGYKSTPVTGESEAIGMIKWIRENYEPEFGDGRHWEDILDEAETPISDKELYNLYKQSKK